ncbi:dipeptide epimerase [Clostridiaceae bacterium 35-E11]
MKITDLKYEKVRIKLKKPFVVALGTIEYCETVIVKILTDEGYFGYGEAAPFSPVTGESVDTVLLTLEAFKSFLIGKDPLAIERIHHIMDRAAIGNTSAKAAIDIALHDIKGKVMGAPLYKVLGGFDNKIQTDMTIGIGSPKDMAEEAKRRVAEGFRILKIKAGIAPENDIEAIRFIREAVGYNIRLRMDANQGWSVNDAVGVSKALEDYKVEAIEQSLPYWNIDGAAFIRSKTNIKVMLDETIHSPYDALKVVRKEAADILNIKLMKSGGLYPAEKINAIAEAAGVKCMLGCMLETRVAITAAASLIAAKRNITETDLDSFMYCQESDGIKGGFVIEGDVITLLNEPGLGININM